MGVVLLWWALAAGASVTPPPVTTPPDDLKTIIVTGERAKRSLKETSSSVTVFDKREIERMAAPDRIEQLLQMVPNVLVPTSRDAPNIRGQSGVGVLSGLPAFLGGARPRTVMQIDGRTVTFNEFVNSSEGLWDVDHVEVFRSPQTTTQGVNSIGGAIFIHTGDPTFEPDARARLIVGEQQRRQASAVISGPLVSDEVALRLSGDIYRSVAATKQTGPVVGIHDLNPDRYWTGRVKVLAAPGGAPGLKVLAIYAHTHSQAPQGELAQTPFHKRRNHDYLFGYFKSDVNSVTTLVSYTLAPDLESRTTLSWGKSFFRRYAPIGFGQTQIHGHDGSLETVLDWKGGGALNGVGGISLQATGLSQFIDLSRAKLGTGTFDDRQRSAGLFGELTWHATERISLTAGGRYQSDSKKRAGVLRTTPDLMLDYDKTSRAFLPKVSAAYDVTPDVRIGALVQRAYNPGGVTLDPAHHAQLDFKPEYMWDYELFTRSTVFDGKVSVNANLFYNDIRDAQRELDFDLSSPAGQVGLLQIISEPRARAHGAELEIGLRPAHDLTLKGAIGLLDTRITKGIAKNDPFHDRQFFGAPHFTGSLAADWEPVRNLHLSTQVHHQSGFSGDDAEDPGLRTPGWTMVDARVGWQSGRLTIFGYAQNLFDKFAVIGFSGPRDDPDVEVGVTDPRELGVGMEARF